ncbi:LysM peptidoglycan-binding domain-containing protein [Aerococcaceae bacterium DSM 111176]|nr:LysM peptidoglycan-binding domain-containing protein [Aerococcaceae bacterium DSM 111176]
MATKKALISKKALTALILSAAAVQLSQVTADAQTVHTVSTGDTLYSIAQQYNVSADDIKAWNGLTSDNINIDQQLAINTEDDTSETSVENTDDQTDESSSTESDSSQPSEEMEADSTESAQDEDESAPTEEEATDSSASESTENSNESQTNSDTTEETSDETGEETNDDTDDTQSQTSSNTYTIRTGDTLSSIAAEHGVTVDDLRNWNDLTSDYIRIGDQLIVSEPDTTEPTPDPDPDPSETTHTVRSGDNLWAIANAYGVSVNNLRNWNNLTTDVLQIGQVLIIQEPDTTEPTPNPDPSETTHTVRSGDSLWAIANAYGVSVNNLRNWNNLTTDVLQIGQVLVIQEPDTTEPTPDPDPSETTHTVRSGDSLWAIANAYGVSVNNLRNWNNLTTDVLQIGQVLVIQEPDTTEPTPDPDPSETTHTVRSGDSLWAIANAYGVSVNNLRNWNNLNTDVLQIGQVLVIQEPDTTDPTPDPDPSETTYTVRSGDSLWLIANNFGVSVNQLRAWNGLTSNLLQIGQVLVVQEPATSPDPSETTYTVRAGDSLWLIANAYGVSVNDLRAWNNLSSNILQIGQVLVIEGDNSGSTPPTGYYYTVVSGDSLWLIANRYGVTVGQLQAWNNLSSNVLQPGQRLMVASILN